MYMYVFVVCHWPCLPGQMNYASTEEFSCALFTRDLMLLVRKIQASSICFRNIDWPGSFVTAAKQIHPGRTFLLIKSLHSRCVPFRRNGWKIPWKTFRRSSRVLMYLTTDTYMVYLLYAFVYLWWMVNVQQKINCLFVLWWHSCNAVAFRNFKILGFKSRI